MQVLKAPGQRCGKAKPVTQGSAEHQRVPGQSQGAQAPPERGQASRWVPVSSGGGRRLTRGRG